LIGNAPRWTCASSWSTPALVKRETFLTFWFGILKTCRHRSPDRAQESRTSAPLAKGPGNHAIQARAGIQGKLEE
jgi:hypothetical protein